MARFGLTVHPDKTRLVRFERPNAEGGWPKPGSLDFLGFTYFWTRTRRGKWHFRRKTAKSRISRSVRNLNQWLKSVRHRDVGWQARELGRKLQGHYGYYGISRNTDSLSRFGYEAMRLWHKWLNRRSQRRSMTWKRYLLLLERHSLPPPRLRSGER